MSERPDRTSSDARDDARPDWGRRVIVWTIALAVLVVLFLIGSAFLPRWWSHRIGDQIDGSTTQGVGVGLFYGVVFTLLPLIILWITFHKRRSPRTWVLGLACALLVAAPNLLTLGIVVGSGDAAHAGERTLDVEAPSFRTSTLIGAIAAAVILGIALWLLASRRRSRREAQELRDEVRRRDDAGAPE